jgi:hypothetical protein
MKRAALSLLLGLGAAAVGGTLAGAQPIGAVSTEAAAKKHRSSAVDGHLSAVSAPFSAWLSQVASA